MHLNKKKNIICSLDECVTFLSAYTYVCQWLRNKPCVISMLHNLMSEISFTMRAFYQDTTRAVVFTTGSLSFGVLSSRKITDLHPVSRDECEDRSKEKGLSTFGSGVLRMCLCMCVYLCKVNISLWVYVTRLFLNISSCDVNMTSNTVRFYYTWLF